MKRPQGWIRQAATLLSSTYHCAQQQNGPFRRGFTAARIVPGLCALGLLLMYPLPAVGLGDETGKPLTPVRAQVATGPLRTNPANGRYLTDDTGKAIYLAGSHTWANMLDRGQLNPPGVAFDYNVYMKWMVAHNFNFMRLWTAELPNAGPGVDVSEGDFVGSPARWQRTGPSNATDGGLKFDLTKLNQAYFDRMRARTITAGQNGIYVSVMLFNGFEWQFDTNPNDGDPFAGPNNVNNIDCPLTCPSDTSQMPDAVWEVEKAYIRKVVDTVNDLDNVLYEVSNEAGSPYSDYWQVEVINYVKRYEATKPKQHPVGMTFQWKGGSDLTLSQSPADWISPGSHLPVSDGSKVTINDTDHAYGWGDLRHDGLAAQRAWVWENFTVGNNVAFMDPYLTVWPSRNAPQGTTADPDVGAQPDPYWEGIRNAMGNTLTYANRMKLVAMRPLRALSSTSYCLVNPGVEYLVYQPLPRSFNLSLREGRYHFEWFNPSTNRIAGSGEITVPNGDHSFTAPYTGDSVLYLRADAGGK